MTPRRAFHKGGKGKGMKSKQSVTGNLEDISDEFVKMSSYGCNAQGRIATREYKALHRAWDRGEISGWKYMATPKDARGCIYVNKKEAENLLRKGEPVCEQANEDSQRASDSLVSANEIQVAVVALCQINGGIAELLEVAQRVAAACEGMAAAWGARQQLTEEKPEFSVFDN